VGFGDELYAVDRIPTQSCVLLDSAEDARRFPTGDLTLAICQTCGFGFNARFDHSLVDYSEDYEETQGYSGTFRAFLTATIEGLADELEPAGQTILEIGCGRGDFLEQFCRHAGTRGIGIDPSQTAGRVPLDAGLGLRFILEPYGEPHHALEVHGIVCRHTLEHLPAVRDYTRSTSAHLANQTDAWTFIEVPDTERILTEGAFWDVYFEHCSYFAKPSLERLFRSNGFDIERLDKVYGDQYLHLLARPCAGPATATCEYEVAPLLEAADHFRERLEAELARWHAWLQASGPGQVALWGSGSKATAFLTTVGSFDRVACVVDINPDKHGKFVAGSGHEIVAPERLVDVAPEKVLIMNPIYRREIGEQLSALGVSAEIEVLG